MLVVFQLAVLGSATVSACYLEPEDFSNYLVAKQRASRSLVDGVAKAVYNLESFGVVNVQSRSLNAHLVKSFSDFENYLRVGLRSGISRSQFKAYGQKHGFSKSLIKDLIFICSIEKFVPDIKKAELLCSNPSSSNASKNNCINSVKNILNKFNLNKNSESQDKIKKNKKHCDF